MPFKQTDIGLIPEDWKFIPLADEKYFKSINGLWKGKKPPFTEVNVIRNTNFTHFGIIDFSDVAVLDVEEKQFINRKLIPGDIIIERSGGGPTQPVGRVVFFNIKDGEFSFSNFTSCLRTIDRNVFVPKFAFYSLLNFYLSGKTNSLQARTTGIRNLNFTSYKEEARVPHISFQEQKKIAHILSKIQQAIETQEQIIKTTQELKKASMQKLFTGGLNGEPQKQTEIGLIPESWEVKEFIDYIVLQRGKDLPKYNFEEGKIPVAGSNGIIGNHSIAFVKAPGVTVGRSGSCGAVIFYELDYWAHNTVLYVKDFNGNCPRFVYYHLQFIDLSRFKSGVSVPTLNRNAFSSMQISIPSIDEQKKIARSLNHIDDKLGFQKLKVNQLKELFKTFLNKLMTGQIRVKDIEFKL